MLDAYCLINRGRDRRRVSDNGREIDGGCLGWFLLHTMPMPFGREAAYKAAQPC
jgi:hypothetical protein